MLTEVVLSLGYIAVCLLLIKKLKFFRHEIVSTKTFQLIFLLKLVAGFALFVIYTRFYPDRKFADIFRYYDDSKIMFDAWYNNPYDFFRMLTGFHAADKDLRPYYDSMLNWYNSEMIFNDSRTMIRLNAVIRFFSLNTYYPHAVFMCFLSFTGLTALFKIFSDEVKNKNYELIFGVYLLPSVLLWSSGVIKEAFLLFSIGMLLYYLKKVSRHEQRKWKNVTALLFFTFCVLNIKSYILFAMLPGLLAYAWTTHSSSLSFFKFIVVHAFYFLALFNFSHFFTHHPVPELLNNKQKEFYTVANREHAQSIIALPVINSGWKSVIRSLPSAFGITLFRPHLFEARNIMILFAAIENALIILLILFAILGFEKNQLIKAPPVFFLAIFFVLIMYCLIGLVTPILGAIVRYKVPALPFLILILITMFNRDTFKNRIAAIFPFKKS